MQKDCILIVDDEKEIGELIKDYLIREGYDVILAYSGTEALNFFRKNIPTLIILDIMMPGIDGMELCRIIRSESSIPILMLSARQSDIDKILSLGLGADDYITKPFSPGELVARVKAHLRRYNHLSQPSTIGKLKYNGIEIDLNAYTVHINNQPVELSSKSFQLLSFLASHPKQVFSREQLYDQVWGYEFAGDLNTVTVHIRKLRQTIEEDSTEPQFIKTVWGVGYKFEP